MPFTHREFIRRMSVGANDEIRIAVVGFGKQKRGNFILTGNISSRPGKQATTDRTRRQIGNYPAFEEMFGRRLLHLKAHDIDRGRSVLGPRPGSRFGRSPIRGSNAKQYRKIEDLF